MLLLNDLVGFLAKSASNTDFQRAYRQCPTARAELNVRAVLGIPFERAVSFASHNLDNFGRRAMNPYTVPSMEILLVEDSLPDAKITLQFLKQGNLRCRVTLVRDGEEALRFLIQIDELARAPTPHLILLDMLLPKKDGRQVLEEIRSDEELMHIPVLVLTGSPEHEEVLKAEGLHVDGFMTKPVKWSVFIEKVKSLRRSWLVELVEASTCTP